MLRLSPPYYNKIEQANVFNATYGGGEANVAISLAKLGHKTQFISKLPNNQLGESALKHLRSYNVDVRHIIMQGDNIGIYFLEMGFGGRTSQVIYNRKHSAFTDISYEMFDFEAILEETDWLHISGITLALSQNAHDTVFKLVKHAKEHNVTVSFDFNYRRKLWTIEEARQSIKQIIPYVDVCFGSIFDVETILGIKSDEKIDDPLLKRKDVIHKFLKTYSVKYLFGTIRHVFSANENALSAYVYTSNNEYITEKIKFNIVDRIGGGDAFVSGVIHGLINNYDNYYFATEFGLVTSVLKHTIQGDACILTEDEIFNYIKTLGQGNVNR